MLGHLHRTGHFCTEGCGMVCVVIGNGLVRPSLAPNLLLYICSLQKLDTTNVVVFGVRKLTVYMSQRLLWLLRRQNSLVFEDVGFNIRSLGFDSSWRLPSIYNLGQVI